MKLTHLLVIGLLAISVATLRAADMPATQPAERTTESGLKIIAVNSIDGRDGAEG